MRALHVTALVVLSLLALAGTPLAAESGTPEAPALQLLPRGGSWILPTGPEPTVAPSAVGSIEIRGLGSLPFDPTKIETQRKDLFRPGQFSVFDVLLFLSSQGAIQMDSTWDEGAGTHLIRSLNGKSGWWYDAHYPGGAFERPVLRMDEYPVKDGMAIQIYLEAPDRLVAILTSFREEIERRERNGGRVILPQVRMTAAQGELLFENVLVTAHDSRPDVLQPGIVTVLDVLLSLGEQGKLAGVGVTWMSGMDGAEPIGGYFVDRIDAPGFSILSTGDCTFAHEVGSEGLMDYLPPHGHKTSHVHLTSDLKVLTSPEYVEFLWSCL